MANSALKNVTGRGNKSGNRARGRDTESDSGPFHVSGNTPISKARNNLRELELAPNSRPPWNAPQVGPHDRPRTSAGDRSSGKKHGDRQRTQDDLHFKTPLTQEILRAHFNFPLPTSSLRPSAPSKSIQSTSPSSQEVKSLPLVNMIPGEIGIALGSPSYQPVISTHAWSEARNDSPDSMDAIIDSDPHTKSKSKKWKLLGLFGKKSVEVAEPFYQVSQQEVPRARAYGVPPSPPPSAGIRGRGKTVSERTNTPKVGIQRAHTVPVKPPNFQFALAPTPEPTPPKKDHPEIRLDGGPLLDVEIPRIEMERYSVMFGSFLKATPAQRQSGALLARRQATLDRLKTVNDEIAEFERRETEAKQRLLHPRRATSPQPSKSPAFTLFPRTSNESSPSIPRRSPLQRSNTSPAALSPNRQTFAHPSPNLNEAEELKQNPDLRATLSSPWSPDGAHLILDSPDTATSREEFHDTIPLKPSLSEPEWEMIRRPAAQDDIATGVRAPRSKFAEPERPSTSHGPSQSTFSFAPSSTSQGPPHSTSSSSTTAASASAPQRTHPRNKSLNSNPVPPNPIQRHPARADSAISVSFSPSQTPKGSISGAKPSPDEAEAILRSAAEISIARQISVSREQRQMLIPLQARIAQAAAIGAGGTTTGKGEKAVISERRHLTPVLIDVGDLSKGKHGGSGGKGHVYKKSETVVIEGV